MNTNQAVCFWVNNNNRGYEHPGSPRCYTFTFQLSDAVTEGQFREFKENLDRCVDKLNEDMVVKLKLRFIKSEKVIVFSETIMEIDDSDYPDVTEKEFVVVFPLLVNLLKTIIKLFCLCLIMLVSLVQTEKVS